MLKNFGVGINVGGGEGYHVFVRSRRAMDYCIEVVSIRF